MFTRLPFGICSAPEHFQKRMSRALNGVSGVALQMDDTLVFSEFEEEHNARVRQALQRLSDNGVTLNPDKCIFKATSVQFLGHLIDQSGIRPDPAKIQGIQDFSPCENVSDVRSFMGMVNQLGKFSPKLAHVSQPIRELLKKETAWCWGLPQQSAFDEVKSILSSAPVLALYLPSLPTVVVADASSYDIGAVIKQQQPNGDWKPVSFQSRALTPAECRYTQIEKEALGLTWACERFSNFLIGKKFQIETDHKPLLLLLSTTPLDSVPPRVLRFRLRLMRFDFSISHVPGKELIIADALSRSPGSRPLSLSEIELHSEAEALIESSLNSLPATDSRLQEILHHQLSDPDCQKLIKFTQDGWLAAHQVPPALKAYFAVQGNLTVSSGLLLYVQRLVIPVALRPQVIEQLHSGHLGITKCCARAQQSVWWPGLSTQLADHVSKCQACVRGKPVLVEPLVPSEVPDLPWQKVGMDFMSFNSSQYPVVVDYYSRCVELALMHSTTAAAVIRQLKSLFARHGYPECVFSDNGPPFSSSDFSQFLISRGVQHITSSPIHSQGNGLAERTVKTVKSLLRRGSDPYNALLSYCTTSLELGYSPAELLMGRRLRSQTPSSVESRRPYIVSHDDFVKRQQLIKQRQARNHDTRHRPEPWCVSLS